MHTQSSVHTFWAICQRHVTTPIFVLLLLLASHAAFAETKLVDTDFVAIASGDFVMGNADIETAIFEIPDGDASQLEDEQPAHHIQIKGFELSRTEVTQGQWFGLMKSRPGPSAYWQRPDWKVLPVVSVSWNDTQRFMAALNRNQKTYRYRLPTEAEWEYAARAGSSGNRPFSRERLDDHAWYRGNSGDVPHPVATRQANAWGLYDMLGNAWEWVDDRYQSDYYAHSPAANPPGPARGEQRVRRGGSYHCEPHLVRVNFRAVDTPDTHYSVIGFRVLREAR